MRKTLHNHVLYSQSEDPEMMALLKDACPHLLLEHGNQGLESSQVELCCAKGWGIVHSKILM